MRSKGGSDLLAADRRAENIGGATCDRRLRHRRFIADYLKLSAKDDVKTRKQKLELCT